MAHVSNSNLLEAGMQYGHKPAQWNPKMKSYIYTTKKDTHIFDTYKISTAIDAAYEQMKFFAKKGDILFVVGNDDALVNSIQKFSDVVIQKSTKEGFCLSVTEALWKGTPVVASNVGGIPVQITDGENGFLLDPYDTEGFAERIVHLLKKPNVAKGMGEKAREIVREKFLITRLLSDYLYMLNAVVT